MSARALACASAAVAATVLAGCGSSREASAGSTGSSSHPSTMATGVRDHVGEFCSNRDQARHAGERLVCVTGRLVAKAR